MSTGKTDLNILIEILQKYVFNNEQLRKAFFPAMALMITGNYLSIKSLNMIKELSKNVISNTLTSFALIEFLLYSLTAVFLKQISSGWLCEFGQKGFRTAQKDSLNYYLAFHPVDFYKLGTGEIQNNIKRRSDAVRDTIDVITLYLIPLIVTTFLLTVNIITNLGISSMIILFIAIILYLVSTIYITEKRNIVRENVLVTSNKNQNVMNDIIANFEVIYTSETKNFEENRFNGWLKITEKYNIQLNRSLYFLNFIQENIWNIAIFLLILINSNIIFNTAIGDVSFLLFTINLVKSSMFNIGFMYGKYKTGVLNYRLSEMIEQKKPSKGIVTLNEFRNSLEIQNFKLCINKKIIFENINLAINRGEKIAIIGINGCGKSSLIKGILNLNEVEGQVFLDSYNENDLTRETITNLFGYIPQSSIVFNESVMYNIKYNQQKIFDEQIMMLAKKMGINEDFIKLRDGYDTNCGENGNKISGGERQKILILRALISGRPILVLDEFTSAIDKTSEEKIFSYITKQSNLTIISIIHNLELLKNFDRIIKIEDGKLLEVCKNDVHLQKINKSY